MRTAKSTGRIVGVLLLAQLFGLIVPFVMLLPVARQAPEILARAATSALRVQTAVALLLANCALTLGISLVVFPLLRRTGGRQLGIALLSAAIAMLALQAFDGAHVLSLLDLSRKYNQAGIDHQSLQTLAASLAARRRWTHYTELFAIDAWIALFAATLGRFRLVPLGLAILLLVTVAMHFGGMVLPGILGYRGITALGASMGVGQIVVAAWLLAKGFLEPDPNRLRRV